MQKMMMRRPATIYTTVLPLLVAVAVCVSFLFQVSDCSRPSHVVDPQPRAIPHPIPVLVRYDEPHVQRHHRDNSDRTGTTRPVAVGPEMVVGAGARAEDGGGVAPSSANTAPARDMVGYRFGSGSSNWGGALMVRPPVVRVRLRSELPRRVLAVAGAPPAPVVEGAADSAAKSSCHSSDVHISCPPSRN